VEPLFAKSALKGRAPAGTHVPRPRPGTHRAAATPPAAHIDARCPVAPPTARATPFCGPFRRVSDLSPGLHCSKARGYFPGTMCLGSLDRGPNLTSRGIRAPTLEFRACGTVAVWAPKSREIDISPEASSRQIHLCNTNVFLLCCHILALSTRARTHTDTRTHHACPSTSPYPYALFRYVLLP